MPAHLANPFIKTVQALAALTFATLTVGCGSSTTPATEPTPEEPTTEPESDDIPEELVRLYLLADVSAVGPGQEFRLAARFDVEPTWHIYWKNPGEAGLPTTVEFEAPSGFAIADVAYPGPVSFESEGPVTSFGYSDLVLLSAGVTTPEDVSGQVTFKVSASWLACREICVPGETSQTMTLPVASAQTPAGVANVAMFTAHEKALPTPFDADTGTMTWLSDRHALEITLPGASSAEYFPTTDEQTLLSGQIAIPSDSGVTLVLSYKKDAPGVARGVLRATRKSEGKEIPSFHNVTWQNPE